MKTQYTKQFRYRRLTDEDFYYVNNHAGYHRYIHTFPELRANASVESDDELREHHIFVRGRRNSKVLDAWNDFAVSRNYKKSWKDFTKHHHQWERTPAPTPSRWERAPKWRKNDQSSNNGLPPL